MKNLFTLMVFFIASITLVLGQGAEGFDRVHTKSIEFSTGSFVGENGINWNFTQCRNNPAMRKEGNEKSTFVLKNDSAAEIISSVISGGIGLLKIDYSTFSFAPVKLEVFINRIKVAVLNAAPSEQGIASSSGNIVVNIDKPFYIRIKQSDETSGQVSIDKVSWSKFSSDDYGFLNSDNVSTLANNVTIRNSGLQKEYLSSVYQLFPNPAKEFVFIEMSEYHNVLFKLYTLAGQMVLQEQVKGSGQKINILNLKEGLYIYKILDDKGKLVTGKMVIR